MDQGNGEPACETEERVGYAPDDPARFRPPPATSYFVRELVKAVQEAQEVLARISDEPAAAQEAIAKLRDIVGAKNIRRALSARSMNEFVPEEGVMVHDGLNDHWFSLTPDWAKDMKLNAHPNYRRALLEWDGLILDGWLPGSAF